MTPSRKVHSIVHAKRSDPDSEPTNPWSKSVDPRVALAAGDPPPEDRRHLLPPWARVESRDHLAPRDAWEDTVELILMAPATWSARDVWRAALSLGFAWGPMDLFHLRDPADGTTVYHMHALTEPYAFDPLRAVEGERIHGVVLACDPAHHPALRPVRRHMVLALAAFQALLGGRPTDRAGATLDARRLATWSDS